jgi:hypothetical protein
MKIKSLTGSNGQLILLSADVVNTPKYVLTNSAVLQAVVNKMFNAAVAEATALGDIVNISVPHIQLLGMQDDKISWYIGCVVIFKKREQANEQDATKVVPENIADIADLASVLGGRISIKRSADLMQLRELGDGTGRLVGDLYGNVSSNGDRINPEHRLIMQQLLQAGVAIGGKQDKGKNQQRHSETLQEGSSEQVHSDNDTGRGLPSIAKL